MTFPLPARVRALARVAACAVCLIGAPAGAADMNKVVRHVFPVAETGFDPAGIQDLYSGTIVQAVFETLLTYDYLARPAHLVPMAAEAMPQVTDNGRTYGVGVAYRLGEILKLGVDVNRDRRESSVARERGYEALRIGASVSYGLPQ